ncbi:conserved hypothetical protein [Planktothrix sp. PCC 11201]|uniref:hypothetical protein n=1 Tax=Planktothrix sp. PCC 11201 TaxID=1729650 RepID=UPI000912279B|nr:hypothetical protein [Planktothrix sp. PCC 11201]SKB15264.1 conserved hypothetical protein [Planktothrix sp. PCC 11201]
MQEILNQYCQQPNPGLLLLSMPTGFGKTHNVLNFIYSNYQEFANQNRKIIFITNLKKNLPIEDFKKRFINDNQEDNFDKYVLFIDSNSETIINNLLSIAFEIPEQFKTEIYDRLKKYVEIIRDPKLHSFVKSKFEIDIRQDLEPKFRKFVQNKLKENFKTKQAKLSAIKNNKDYQWIGKLYPSVFTDERTVLFLSMDKFLVKNATLIEDSYYCYERLVDQALIFIDEFDSTKEAVLTNIIQSGLEHRLDMINSFLNIHNHLMQSECPTILFQESNWRKKHPSRKNWLSLLEQINSFKTKADQIFNKYKLQHSCKSDDQFSVKKRNFLFYDYEFHYVLDASNKRIEIVEDSENRTNWIKAFDAGTKGSGVDIRSLLSEIAGFLMYFQRGVKYLADNYRHLKQEDDRIKELYHLESAVKTVLHDFKIDSTYIQLLTRKIIEGDLLSNLQTETGTIQGQGFYDRGFRYHDIVDSDEHDTLSKIYMFNFSRTPESFLAGVCSKAMVVGISATAGLYTNIGNYDLEYLKYRLKDSFIRLQKDKIDHLKESYSQATQGYNQIKIETQFIKTDGKNEAIKQLEFILDDQQAAQALWNTVRQKMKDEDEKTIEFSFSRYVRALTAWKYFLDHPDCHGFLCLFTKFPKSSDPKFDRDIFNEYAELLLEGKKDVIDSGIQETIVVLSTDEFDQNKSQLLKDLKENKRRFILSTYQTLGVGQNLQFPIPDSIKPIQINSFPQDKNMDINGIYLDSPRHLLVNLYGDNIQDEDFIKYIFQLEFLRENGAISRRTFKNYLDTAFHRFVGRSKSKRKAEDFISLYNTKAYSLFLNKVIIQAIGRICRTNMKAPTIHILADDSIRKHLTRFSVPEDVIPVGEYTALLESAGELNHQSEDVKEAENIASHRSNQTAAYIRSQLSKPWQSKSIQDWQDLRVQVLRQPTISQDSEWDQKWNPIYLKLPKAANFYYFLQENDYNDIEVFFSDSYGKKAVKTVSQETARLTDLMRIDSFHKLFINSGWATEFPESERMLTPPMFNNIYKGALGEVCGKHIFENFLNIPLLELDIHEFERFDFKTNQNIYIDFKFWNDTIAVEADELTNKIREKMEDVGADRVFIINILGSSTTDFKEIISPDGKIVQIPYLCKNDKIDNSALEFIKQEFSK